MYQQLIDNTKKNTRVAHDAQTEANTHKSCHSEPLEASFDWVGRGTKAVQLLQNMQELGVPEPKSTLISWVFWDNAYMCCGKTVRIWFHGIYGPHSNAGDGVSQAVCCCKPDVVASTPNEELNALRHLKAHLTKKA